VYLFFHGAIMTQTTVFQSDNSQAVRLPKDFRNNTKTVEIFRRGNEVVLREVPRTMGDLIRHLPNFGDDFPDDIAELDAMLDIIDEPQAADRETDYFSRDSEADITANKPQKPQLR
jgi:antitoxin VapB